MEQTSRESILRFENVSIAFGGQSALRDVSFNVSAGDTRVIFGAAGSGKSVCLKIALGLLRPTSGRVFLFGQDVTTLDEQHLFAVRSKMGVLFQEGGLFDSLTVEENVAYPLQNQPARERLEGGEIHRRVREALRFVELEHTLEKYPAELSGGMRRRVGIARAMVTEPPLMLYDSPTAGLDPITANTIMALIVKARDTRGTTSMLVTHRYQDGEIAANYVYNKRTGQLQRSELRSAGGGSARFMVFKEGQLVFEDTEEELENARDPYVQKFRTPGAA